MPGGRPKKWNTEQEVNEAINKYFASCERPYLDKNAETVTNINGEILMEQYKPYTIGGLADALDMTRQSLLNYQKNDEFFDTIIRAKRKCEVYAEERLFDRDGVNGAKFNLINNYAGWSDKQEVKNTVTVEKSPIDELIKSIEDIKK